VRTGQTTAQAIASSMALVKAADELGFRRYWFAEHHNMPAVASTSPAVLIAAAVTQTARIRLGSGGVMLPNHAPLIVGEQFAALEAIAPGRIDLGLGRAPGSDPVITQLLRRTGTTSEAQQFPDHVQAILQLMGPDGATVRFTSGAFGLISTSTATPPGSPATISLRLSSGVVELGQGTVERWEVGDVPPPAGSSSEISSGAAAPLAIGHAGHLNQWRDILRSLADGAPPEVGARDAVDTVRLLCAIYEAAATGRTVRPADL